MGAELTTIQTVSPMVAAVLNTTTSLLTQIRLKGAASAAQKQALHDQVEVLRASDISQALSRLGLQNIQHMLDLYDLAATRAGTAAYEPALAEAAHATRLLRENLDNLARRLR